MTLSLLMLIIERPLKTGFTVRPSFNIHCALVQDFDISIAYINEIWKRLVVQRLSLVNQSYQIFKTWLFMLRDREKDRQNTIW